MAAEGRAQERGGSAQVSNSESDAGGVRSDGVWTRAEVFGSRWTERSLSEFVAPDSSVNWVERNPYVDVEPSETRAWLLGQRKWRYHHGIEALRKTAEFYSAYSGRVEAMLSMLDAALDGSGVVLGNSSFVDLGAAEGYAANHLFDRGAVDVDSCDLNKDGIERLWRIRAFTGRSFGRLGVLDLDHAGWAMELGRSYDVALALGVIYHLENPLLFARNLRHITRRIAIIESDTPVFPQNERFRGFGNLYLHRDQVRLRPGDDAHRFVTELRPDRQALVEILLTAGFARVQHIPSVKLGMSPYFDSGEKTVLLAFVE